MNPESRDSGFDASHRPGMTRENYFFFGSHFSTGPPASRQAAKPPPMWATGFRPMSCAVLAACRTKAAGAVEDELLVFLEDRLGVGALRIDPEFQHAAGAGECAGDLAIALDLAGVSDIDDYDARVLRGLDGISRADSLDRSVGFVDQGFDAAVDGLGHEHRHSGMVRRTSPGMTAMATAPVPSSRFRGLRS
ncbi:hypothetical protein V1283_005490 [Bradyrhizobium sp. AZCC 2262]